MRITPDRQSFVAADAEFHIYLTHFASLVGVIHKLAASLPSLGFLPPQPTRAEFSFLGRDYVLSFSLTPAGPTVNLWNRDPITGACKLQRWLAMDADGKLAVPGGPALAGEEAFFRLLATE